MREFAATNAMLGLEIKSRSFKEAELRTESVRVAALLAVLGSLLAMVLVRGIAELVQGRRSEAWPFAALLTATICYEAGWLVYIRRPLRSIGTISRTAWRTGAFVESLLPTVALFLLIGSSFTGPRQALTSPAVLVYFLSIILSTLHLDSALSRLTGMFSAIGYTAAAAYVVLFFRDAVEGRLFYITCSSYAAFLIIGGFAAGVVAEQLRLPVLAALRDADNRAKIARLEEDLGIARTIQQGLLPKAPPQIEGFDIAGWNQPADETGGDYFDWQELDDGQIVLTVADVTGHGIGPAICMSACRAYARAIFTAEPELHPALCRLNQLLLDDLSPERFVTLAAGVLSPKEATLDLISAGQGPLLFYLSRESRFRSYDAQGVPLGLLSHPSYGSPQRIRFFPGDILALVTDGFIEWDNAEGDAFGQTRLKSVISANRERPAANIISEIYKAVLSFAAGRAQRDDLTILVVKRI